MIMNGFVTDKDFSILIVLVDNGFSSNLLLCSSRRCISGIQVNLLFKKLTVMVVMARNQIVQKILMARKSCFSYFFQTLLLVERYDIP
jgi:hypothetical protein